MESGNTHASGLIVRHAHHTASNWRSSDNLASWLRARNIVGIQGVDTRRLTRHIRQQGAQPGWIMSGDTALAEINPEKAVAQARKVADMSGQALAPLVSTKSAYDWDETPWTLGAAKAKTVASTELRIGVCDFGCKYNSLRLLRAKGCDVRVFPYSTPADEILAWQPHGIFLSNGPGDPAPCSEAILTTRTLIQQRLPLLGICLGHQILALALGARTEKMKFGHHGSNHPVLEIASGRVFVSSQNHGFTLSDDNWPEELEVTHRSLFDNSIQGFRHKQLPFSGFQGHPEASPGPAEMHVLFDDFVARATANKTASTKNQSSGRGSK